MPRTRTTATERTEYNDRIKREVEGQVGFPVSVRQATEYKQWQAGKLEDEPVWVTGGQPSDTRGAPRGGRTAHLIPQKDVQWLADRDDLEPIGVLLAQVEDFKMLKGGVACLSLTTSVEFSHLLVDAGVLSAHEVLVCVMHKIPREAVEENDPSDG